jgi:hypothetical protein
MESQLRRLKPGKLIFIGLLSLILASTSVSSGRWLGVRSCNHTARLFLL